MRRRLLEEDEETADEGAYEYWVHRAVNCTG
jgi:hypothetical protein